MPDYLGCSPPLAQRLLEAPDADLFSLEDAARLLHPRLGRYDGQQVTVLAEENSKVLSNTLGDVTTRTYSRLEAAQARRPATTPSYAVVGKRADAALPLADIVLGIFADYARVRLSAAPTANQKTKPGAQAVARFEQVRDRIRTISDIDSRVVFSRRQPFTPW